MNHKDISEWFCVNDEEIDLLFTNWLQDDNIQISTKLKFMLLCQLGYIHRPYKRLKGKHRHGITQLTTSYIREVFNIITNEGFTFKIYSKTSSKLPSSDVLFIIDCMYNNKYKMRSALRLSGE